MVNSQEKYGQQRRAHEAGDEHASQQDASSGQSARGQEGQQGGTPAGGTKAGIGSSQGQDRPSPGPGKSRGEQSTVSGSTRVQSGSEESIVKDPTGAFKER